MAGGGGSYGAQQLLAIRALDEVAAGSGSERREHRGAVVVHRDDEDVGAGKFGEDAAGRLDAVQAGHGDVHENHVGSQPAGQFDGLLPGAGLADQLGLRVGGEDGA